MMKSDGKVFNRICLETGLKPNIPTLDPVFNTRTARRGH